MKKLFFLLMLLYAAYPSYSQEFQTKYLFDFGNPNWETLAATTIDTEGNTYLTGSFTGTLQFGPLMTISNGERDIFLAKIDKDGTPLWLKNYGGDYDENAYSIIENGQFIYLAGSFKKKMTFEDYNKPAITARGFTDLVFLKVNVADGMLAENPLVILSTKPARKAFLQKDADGKIVIAGTFQNDLSIGSGLLAVDNIDIYYATYNEGSKTFENAVRFGGAEEELLNDFFINPANDYYFAGSFKDNFSVGGANIAIKGKKTDAFLIKIDNAGQISANSWGGDYKDEIKKITVDDANNLFIAGEYEHAISIGTSNFTTDKKKGGFLAQLDESCSVLWKTQISSETYNTVSSLTMAGADNFYVTGTFRGTLGGKVSQRNSKDAFMARYRWNGLTSNWEQCWLISAGHNYEDNLQLKRFHTGELLIGGFYSNAYQLKKQDGALVVDIKDKNYKDLFIGKLVECETMPPPGLSKEYLTCSQVKLTAPDGYLSYSWNDGTFSDVKTYTVTQAETVKLTVVDNNNCDLSNEVAITLNNNIAVGLEPYKTICEGTSLTLDAGAGYSSYMWNTKNTEQTITVTEEGTYSVTVSDGTNCGSGSVEVTVVPNPVVDLGPDMSAATDEYIYLDSGAGNQSYLWSSGQNCRLLCVPMSAIDQPTDISVEITDQNGCKGDDVIRLSPITNPPVAMAINPNSTMASAKSDNTNATSSEQEQDETVEEDNGLFRNPTDFKLFPNPTSGKLTVLIPGSENVRFVNVYNMQGNLVKSFSEIMPPQIEIDLTGYTKGTYLIKIVGKEKIKEFKVIRN